MCGVYVLWCVCVGCVHEGGVNREFDNAFALTYTQTYALTYTCTCTHETHTHTHNTHTQANREGPSLSDVMDGRYDHTHIHTYTCTHTHTHMHPYTHSHTHSDPHALRPTPTDYTPIENYIHTESVHAHKYAHT